MTSESAEFERLRQRAVAIGEGDELGAAAELVSLLDSPSPRVRRAAASAMGKYNVSPKIKGSATVDGKYELESDDEVARFFKAVIEL